MSRRNLVFWFPLLIALMSITIGCSSHSDGGVLSSGSGQITVEIHDHAAPEIAECWITIEEVHVRRQHGDWTFLNGDYPHHFDLMQLQGGQTRVLGSDAVPADDYDHVRLHMTAAHLVMLDGEEIDVALPPGGLQIDLPMGMRCEVPADSGAHVSIDFRVPTSFFHAGDESWTCDPDIVVDDIWPHGQMGHHG